MLIKKETKGDLNKRKGVLKQGLAILSGLSNSLWFSYKSSYNLPWDSYKVKMTKFWMERQTKYKSQTIFKIKTKSDIQTMSIERKNN